MKQGAKGNDLPQANKEQKSQPGQNKPQIGNSGQNKPEVGSSGDVNYENVYSFKALDYLLEEHKNNAKVFIKIFEHKQKML